METGVPQQQYFNFYPANANYYQQTPNCAPTQSGATQRVTQHPGVYQHTSLGANHHFWRYPGTNLFLHQQMRTTRYPATRFSGLNQLSPQNIPGPTYLNGIPHPGHNYQHTGTLRFPGPPLFTPYLGNQQPGTNQVLEERTPCTTTSQCQQTATQLNSETLCASGNVWQKAGDKLNTFSNDNVFGKTGSPSGEPKSPNACQFSEPNMKESESGTQNNLPESQTGWPHFLKLELIREEQTVEQKQAEEARQKIKEKIDKSIRVNHLITNYAKIRTLMSLCRDFETPVFGDFPGSVAEPNIMKNLAYFLKEQINKIKFVENEDRSKITFNNEDSVLLASFPVIIRTINEFAAKKGRLELEMKAFEKLSKDVKGIGGELEKSIKEAVTLKTDAEAYNSRLDKLKERQETERKANNKERSQFEKEMEQINKIQIHSLHENLRTLQEKIGKETKGLNEARRELKSLKERNDILRERISEVEKKNENFKKIILSDVKRNVNSQCNIIDI